MFYSRLTSLATFVLLSTSAAVALPASRRDLSLPISLPTSWTSLGCYSDDVSDRTLNIISLSDASGMTAATCIAYCQSKGYSFAGTEYSQQCFCSNSLNSDATALDESSCDMACSGDSTQSCGGAAKINVYSSSSSGSSGSGSGSSSSSPSTAQTIGSWSYAGCYSDVVGARTLLNEVTLGGTTNQECTAACQAQGYKYAGTEYADECYCGNEFSNGGAPASGGCNMVCQGDSSQYCGGSNRLTVYSFSDSSSSSSSTSSTDSSSSSSSTSSSSSSTDTGSSSSSTSSSSSSSSTSSSSSSSSSSTSSTSTSSSSSSTSTSSSTSSSSSSSSSTSSTSTSSSSSSSSSTSTSTSSSSTSAPTTAASGTWKELGCYSMTNVNLSKGVLQSKATTAGTCQSSCSAAGYNFAGFLFTNKCYCYPTLTTSNNALTIVTDVVCKLCDSIFSNACSKIESLMHVYQFTPAKTTSSTATSTKTRL